MELLFYFLIFVVAFLYSSVGHGGASGYLALMAVFAYDIVVMKSTALTMNLFVAGVAFYMGYKAGYFRLKLLIPFILGSMPMAFLGAKIDIEPKIYLFLLGIFLIIASLRIFIQPDTTFEKTKTPHWSILVGVGALLGFLSGMLGIGGGVILSPLMLLFRWAKVKEVSVISAAFIFLNSISGLLGIVSKGIHLSENIFILVVVGLSGAMLGSYSSVNKFSGKTIRYILSMVLFSASLKLILN